MSRIYPIGGGKGGSGKSFIIANLGVLLAKQGKEVVLVDLDLGASNLHTFIGIKNPPAGLHDFLNRSVSDLEQVVLQTVIPHLHLISSTHCGIEIANLYHTQKLKIIRAIQKLPFDYILLDLGAGTNFNTIDFFLASDEGMFVVTPEPTSIENTFRFVKAVYVRKVKQFLEQQTFRKIIEEIESDPQRPTSQSPADMIDLVSKHDPEKGRQLQEKLGQVQFNFILNQFRKYTDSTLGNKIEKVCNRHFYSRFVFLGHVRYDEKVHDSIFSKEVYINKYPYSETAMDLQKISKKFSKNGSEPVFPSMTV
ncbi:MAG: AAA family ATPase [Pseudomonadota bacterium]